MKKCIVIPDSFKGSMSSAEACEIIKSSVHDVFHSCHVEAIPIADGGEGTTDCFLYSLNAKKVNIKVKNAFMEDTEVYYAVTQDKKAIIEIAQPCGITCAQGRFDPVNTGTYGVGQMMAHAIDNGADEIIIGLGGSCTNDGGCGAAAAMGTIFKDRHGKSFIPTGGTLKDIFSIDNSKTCDYLKNVKITAMCDVTNPMYGKNGAAYIFAPQKGADKRTVEFLDGQLAFLAGMIKRDLCLDVSGISGGGAAGALGAGIAAFFKGDLRSGIDVVLDLVNFDEIIYGTDVIFTGEGRIDGQSLNGKAIFGIGRRALKYGVPVIAFTGEIGDEALNMYENGITAIFSINTKAEDFSVSKYKCRENLKITADSVLRVLQI